MSEINITTDEEEVNDVTVNEQKEAYVNMNIDDQMLRAPYQDLGIQNTYQRGRSLQKSNLKSRNEEESNRLQLKQRKYPQNTDYEGNSTNNDENINDTSRIAPKIIIN